MTTTPPEIPPVPPVPPPPADVPRPPPPTEPEAPTPPPLLPPLRRPLPPPSSGPPRPIPVARGLWLALGAVITAVLIVGGAFQLVTAAVVNEADESLAMVRVSRVVVDVDAGSIEVRGGDRDAVVGVRHVERSFGRPTIDESVSDDTLFIRSRCDHLIVNRCSVSYALDVPRAVAVEAHSRAGHVTVTGIDGDVRAGSDAGSVTGDDIGGHLQLTSRAGRIEGARLRSETAEAETSAGRVTLAFTTAPLQVTARSSVGNIDIEVPDDGEAYRVAADSSVDESQIQVPTDAQARRRIDATTSAGAIRIATG
jgi:hypothetical protein